MLIDAHAHFHRPEELAARRNIRTLYCGTNPETAARALKLRRENAPVSCGLHPWFADRYAVSDMLPFIERADALGEIGLDSVWTDVDMAVQRAAFEKQLELAERLGLPVILHTKGMEAEIARMIAGVKVHVLVHWYSCGEHLEKYLEQGCWFSVGPDYESNPAVRRVLRLAPLDRVLTETDGLEAVEWALGRRVGCGEIEDVLRGELRAIAQVHGIGMDEAEERIEKNFLAFLGRDGGNSGCRPDER